MKIKEIFKGGRAPEEAAADEVAVAVEASEVPGADEVTEVSGDICDTGDGEEELRQAVVRLAALLEEAEAERAHRERELAVLELLSQNGLPATLLPLIMGAEGDEAELVAELSRVILEAAERTVMERCRSASPAGGRAVGLTSEEILKTPVAELARSMYLRK